jgi:AGCS family alanine or glycine:cation symporter
VLTWIEQAAGNLSDQINGFLGPVAHFLEGYVWNWPEEAPLLAILLLGTGLYVTARLAFVQLRGFRHAIDIARGVYDDPENEGDLSHFQALTTALSATVGIGNIAGVAIAIRMGGPGALFWMWLTAFFGMALKYAECTLALKYRHVHKDGSVSGGPMFYIAKGLGGRWKIMAAVFAGCAAVCSFGSGCMNQSNTLAVRIETQFNIPAVWSGLVFAALVALVIIGGIKRIGRVTSVLTPFMAILYVGGALIILAMNMGAIPSAFGTILTQAFAPESMAGGAAGSILMTVMWGIRRGLFSNEAGQGSAPIAHATAKTDEPVREGLVASLGPFIDTLVICTMTGLVIVISGAWLDKVPQSLSLSEVAVRSTILETASAPMAELYIQDGLVPQASVEYFDVPVENVLLVDTDGAPWNGTLLVEDDGTASARGGNDLVSVTGDAVLTGADLTARGFGKVLGKWGYTLVTFAVILFAVSTAISWSYYGDRSTEYLFGAKAIPIYRWFFVAAFFIGCILPLKAVWTWGDVALGLMSLPNLIALILLVPKVKEMTLDYFSREHVRPDSH